MKTYKDMARSALNRIEEYEMKRNKKKKLIKQISVAGVFVCFVLAATIGLLKTEIFDEQVQIDGVGQKTEKITETTNKEVTNTTTTNTTKNALYYESTTYDTTTKKQTTTRIESTTKNDIEERSNKMVKPPIVSAEIPLNEWLKDDRVIWSDIDLKGSIDFAKPINKGSIAVADELSNAIKNNGNSKVYAVMVSFESSLPDEYEEKIECDGKTVAELKKQADDLLTNGENAEAKKLYVKINEAKRAYFIAYIDNFKATFSKNNMGIYTETVGTTIDNMIFYTFATADQIQNFTCKDSEAFYFTLAMRFK